MMPQSHPSSPAASSSRPGQPASQRDDRFTSRRQRIAEFQVLESMFSALNGYYSPRVDDYDYAPRSSSLDQDSDQPLSFFQIRVVNKMFKRVRHFLALAVFDDLLPLIDEEEKLIKKDLALVIRLYIEALSTFREKYFKFRNEETGWQVRESESV